MNSIPVIVTILSILISALQSISNHAVKNNIWYGNPCCLKLSCGPNEKLKILKALFAYLFLSPQNTFK